MIIIKLNFILLVCTVIQFSIKKKEVKYIFFIYNYIIRSS